MAPKHAFSKKVAFFKKVQLSIGPVWLNLEEMCQKWILEPLFSEIYMKIEVFFSLKHNSTSASIAQLAERLTFFI
jgi:hypothetical protein